MIVKEERCVSFEEGWTKCPVETRWDDSSEECN